MRIIKIKTLQKNWTKHPDAESALREWIRDVRGADWETPNQVQSRYPNARTLKDNRVVFGIKGNDYRLIVHIFYPAKVVYIKWFGTHAEYDHVDPLEVDDY
jgi:mRNA interferase HigB